MSILQYYSPTNASAINPKRSPLKLQVPVNRSVSLLPSKTQQIIQPPSNIRSPTNTSTVIKYIAAATKQKLKAIRNKVFKRKKQQTNTFHSLSKSPSYINYNLRQRPTCIFPSNKVKYYPNHSYSSDFSHSNASNSSSSFTSNDCSHQFPIQHIQPEILFYGELNTSFAK